MSREGDSKNWVGVNRQLIHILKFSLTFVQNIIGFCWFCFFVRLF